MRRITIELMRKRSEHNEGEISTMKELSLHQEKLQRIENIDRWCRELEILLLQNNNISKIENVSRLKHLKYLNLALNNIEIIEGLEGCESLEKLDLTLNFIGEITSVKRLAHNIHLRNLYLVGNPCSDFEFYKDYVIANLPQISTLDGEDISKSKRILANQNIRNIEDDVLKCQSQYIEKRNNERRTFNDEDLEDEDFWSQTHPNTPEVRALIQKRVELEDDEKNGIKKTKECDQAVKERTFFKKDGTPFNINDGKYPIKLSDDPEQGLLIVEIGIPKFMDTSLLCVDVQPTYVRVIIKKKFLQVCLAEEVKPDASLIQRSTTTGALVIKMPMLNQCRVISFQQEVKAVKKMSDLDSAKRVPCYENEESARNQKGKLAKKEAKKFSRDTTSLMFNEDEVPPLE